MLIVVDEYDSGEALFGCVGDYYDDVRPHYGGGWALCWHLHNWLVERDINYSLSYEAPFWKIEVDDNHLDEIILFKMKFLGKKPKRHTSRSIPV